MLSFEDAGKVLDAAVERLPEGIFEELNGGVNLLPDERQSEDGRYTLGLYHHGTMGRYVEIFYGSFRKVFPNATDSELAEELEHTLRHELTHHIESLAGDRTLEHWDEEQTALWREGEPLRAERVLLIDDDCSLSLRADALLRAAAKERGLTLRSGWSSVREASAGLLDCYDAVLCMTMEQAETLAERFPEADEKIMCLGERDILPGRHSTERQLRREIEALADELAEGNANP